LKLAPETRRQIKGHEHQYILLALWTYAARCTATRAGLLNAPPGGSYETVSRLWIEKEDAITSTFSQPRVRQLTTDRLWTHQIVGCQCKYTTIATLICGRCRRRCWCFQYINFQATTDVFWILELRFIRVLHCWNEQNEKFWRISGKGNSPLYDKFANKNSPHTKYWDGLWQCRKFNVINSDQPVWLSARRVPLSTYTELFQRISKETVKPLLDFAICDVLATRDMRSSPGTEDVIQLCHMLMHRSQCF